MRTVSSLWIYGMHLEHQLQIDLIIRFRQGQLSLFLPGSACRPARLPRCAWGAAPGCERPWRSTVLLYNRNSILQAGLNDTRLARQTDDALFFCRQCHIHNPNACSPVRATFYSTNSLEAIGTSNIRSFLPGFRESALRASRALPGAPLKAAAGQATTTVSRYN
jgi:hypothetical protein